MVFITTLTRLTTENLKWEMLVNVDVPWPEGEFTYTHTVLHHTLFENLLLLWRHSLFDMPVDGGRTPCSHQ